MCIGATTARAAASEAEALNTAIHYTRTKGRSSGPLQISSSGASTLNRAQIVFNGTENGAPLAEGPQGQATSYVFVLVSDTLFAPNVPHPRGHKGPSGKYMGLVVDAKVNQVDDLYLGPTPPNIAELGTVVTINLSAAVETASTSCRADHLLATALARKRLGARHRSAVLALDKCLARHHRI
jgi:hypothetical protein